MKYPEYEKIIQDILKKPEEAPVIAQTLLENIKNDCELIDSQNETIQTADKKIRDLQDTNIKLFIGQTRTVEQKEETPELQGEDFVNNFINTKLKEET